MAVDLARIEDWLRHRALPFWATTGRDAAGGFHEGVDYARAGPLPDGPPPDKRCRTQARQIYVYSHARRLLLYEPAGAVAADGYRFLTRHYWHDDGGWMFAVTAAGEPSQTQRRVYEQAFVLLALAWLRHAGGGSGPIDDAEIDDWIARTVAALDAQLADAGGGYWDPEPDRLPRAQNPHMHLLEAWLALHTATGAAAWLDRAAAVVALFERHFFDAAGGALGEYFAADWSPAPGPAGDAVEPGHHFEWIWLLAHYAAASGHDLSRPIGALWDFAVHHGVDADGLAFDGVTRTGTVSDTGKRLWVQTEFLKAQTSLYETTGDRAYAAGVEALLDRLFDCYLNSAVGHWREHLARDRTPLRNDAPATSFYHVFVALTEVLRVFGNDTQTVTETGAAAGPQSGPETAS